jgi:Protein of unknown function (DUF3638)
MINLSDMKFKAFLKRRLHSITRISIKAQVAFNYSDIYNDETKNRDIRMNILPLNPTAVKTIQALENFLPYKTADLKNLISQPSPLSEEQQRQFSVAISDAMQNYVSHSPYPRPSFINRVWENFTRFFRWLFGYSPKLSNEELKLNLAMNVFRNYESNLCNGAELKEAGFDLPFSVALSSYCHFLKSVSRQINVPSETVLALEYCVKLSKEIETCRSASASTRETAIKRMVKNLQDKIEKLKPGDTLYMPGGYLRYTQLDNKVDWSLSSHLSAQETTRTHMIYEIKKDPLNNNRLLFKVYNYSSEGDKLIHSSSGLRMILESLNISSSGICKALETLDESTVTQYCVEKKELCGDLSALIEAQAMPHSAHNLSWFDSLLYNFNLAKRMVQWKNGLQTLPKILGSKAPNEAENLHALFLKAQPPMIQDLSVTKFANVFQKLKSKIENKSDDGFQHQTKTEPVKLIEIFSKCLLPYGNTQLIKLMQKTVLFLDIYHAHIGELDNYPFRKWLKDSAINLLESYHKYLFDPVEVQPIIRYFGELVERISQIDEGRVFNELPGIASPQPSSKLFTDSLAFAQPSLDMGRFTQTAASVSRSQPQPMSKEPNAKKAVSEALKTCELLSSQNKLEELHLITQDLFNRFETLDMNNFWSQLNANDAEMWSWWIQQLCSYSSQVTFGLKLALAPSQISHILWAIKTCQQLAQKNDNQTCFGNFCLDMDSFKDILQDPYLDLGSEGPKIHATIKEIENAGKTRVDLTNPNSEDMQSPNDQLFFSHYRQVHSKLFLNLDKKETKSILEEDFGKGKGKLAKQIIHLRRIKIIATTMMAMYRTLGNPSLYEYLKNALGLFLSSKDKKLSDLEAIFVKQKISEITNLAKTLAPPYAFTTNEYFLIKDHTVHIGAKSLDYMDYNKPPLGDVISPFASKRFPSQYKNTGPEVPKNIAFEIIEGCVGDADNKPIHEDGTVLQPASIAKNFDGSTKKEWSMRDQAHYIPSGMSRTEQSAYGEHQIKHGLSPDVWAELCTMQTDPTKTRIPNTLETFVRYSTLLGKDKEASAWQRVFSLNLFRNNALGNFLEEMPEYTPTLISNLQKLSTLMLINKNVRGFLFIAHISSQICSIITNEKEAMHELVKTQQGQIQEWLQTYHRKKMLKPHARLLHETFLLTLRENLKDRLQNTHYNALEDPAVCPLLPDILKSHFVLQQTAIPIAERNFANEENITYMMHRLFPACQSLLKQQRLTNPVAFNQFFNSLAATPNGRWQEVSQDLCYKNEHEDVQVDMKTGRLFVNGSAKCCLPAFVAHDPFYQQLFGESTIYKISCNTWNIASDATNGEIYEFVHQEKKYRLLILPEQDPLLYQEVLEEKGKTNWYLYCKIQPETAAKTSSERTLPPKAALPQVLLNNYLWVAPQTDNFRIENGDGKLLFHGEFLKDAQIKVEKQSLSHKKIATCKTNSGSYVLNPWAEQSFERFLAIASPHQILATGSQKGDVAAIKYLDCRLEYQWNPEEKKWACTTLPGYSLSSKKLEAYTGSGGALSNAAKKKANRIFSLNFPYYQILEHPAKQSKLLLSLREYTSLNDRENKVIGKSNHQLVPQSANDPGILYQYSIDPFGELKSPSPEGYLYLAYLFYIQSNYEYATYYLTKARNIKPEQSTECQKILDWIDHWDDATDESCGFILHVLLHVLDNSPSLKKKTPLSENQKKMIAKLKITHERYEKVNLRKSYRDLSPDQHSRIRFYLNLIDPIKQHNAASPDLKKSIDQLKRTRENQRKKINLRLSSSCINPAPGVFPASGYMQPIFSEKVRKKILDVTYKHEQSQKLNDLKTADNKKDSFAGELVDELLKDIDIAVNESQTSKALHQQDLTEISQSIAADYANLENEMKELKKMLLSKILPHALRSCWEPLSRTLKGYSELYDQSFTTVLHEAANDNAEKLTDLVGETEVEAVKALAKNYLEKKTLWQQHLKARNLIEQYKNTGSNTKKNRLAEILSLERHYDPAKDPLAMRILLLEAEQEIIVKKSQIDHFRLMITQKNILKHAACGDGKTTVVRPLVLDYKADGKTLSCAITHQPLIATHHKYLETATSEAFGGKAHRFEFNREYPTDASSLQAISHNLCTDIYERVRLDFTPSDILSLHHSLLLKFAELEHPTRDVNDIHDELDGLAEILDIFKNYAFVSSDEFDKIVEANKQHNYGLGAPKKLDEKKCGAALKLVEWILSSPKYAETFKRNHLWKNATPRLVHEFSEDMASQICRELIAQCHINKNDEQLMIRYLTEIMVSDPNRKALYDKSKQILEFRNKVISKLPAEIKLELEAYQRFLQKVIPSAFKKQNGLHYIRSEDGVSVKPVSMNGVPNEVAEFGSEEEAIWYTCLNYMDTCHENSGVTVEQIANLVLDTQNRSAAEALNRVKESDKLSLLQNTEIDKIFRERFGKDLANTTPEDYPEITKTLNKNPRLLTQFLQHYVFPLTELRTTQIIGTPHHLTAMFKEFSGSSGTSNIWRSLPAEINVKKEYVKQPGIDGSIFLALAKDFDDSTCIIYDDKQDIAKEFSNILMKEKSAALIDCAPAFPGMTADKIAPELSKNMPNACLRYTDKDDCEMVLNTATKEVSLEGDIFIEDSYTILGHSQRRGTNKEMADHTTGIITINKMTTLTDFSQSVKRMRKLGKGQKIKIAMDRSTYEHLNGKPTLATLAAMLCENDAEFLKVQHYEKSEIQKIQTLSENAIYDELKKIKDRDIRVDVWKKCKHFFIKSTCQPLDKQLAAFQEPTIDVLKQLANEELKKVENLIRDLERDKNLSEGLTSMLEQLHKVKTLLDSKSNGKDLLHPKYLPEYSSVNKFDIDVHNFVQKEQEVHAEQEMEQELEINQNMIFSLNKPVGFDLHNLNITSVQDLLQQLNGQKQSSALAPIDTLVNFYDKNLFFTKNLFNKEHNVLPWPSVSQSDFFSSGQTRIRKLAVLVDKNHLPHPKVYAVLGGLKDFDHTFCPLDRQARNDPALDLYIYNLSTDELEGCKASWNRYPPEVEYAVARAVVQAKHLAGETDLLESKQENALPILRQFSILKNWLQEKMKEKLILPAVQEKKLLEYLKVMRPSLLSGYAHSPMDKAYRSLKPKPSDNKDG